MTSSQVEDFAIYARVNKKQKQRHRNRNLDDTSAPSTSHALSSTEMASQINTARAQRNESHDMEARYKNLIAASVDDRIDSSKSSSSDTIAAAQVATSKWEICKSQRFWIIALLIVLLMTVLLSCGIIAALSSEISNLKSDLNHTKEDLVSLEIHILGITTNMSHEIQGVIENKTSHIHDKLLSVITAKTGNNFILIQSNSKRIDSTSTNSMDKFTMAAEGRASLGATATRLSSQIRDLKSNFSSLSDTFKEKLKQLNDTKANNNALYDITNSTANAVPLFSSCSDIFNYLNTSMSGYYWLRSFNDAVRAYCNFTVNCNGIAGGWMRIAKLTKNNGKAQCFQGMQNYGENASLCERKADSIRSGCSNNTFPVGVPYSQVCGQIHAYGLDSPDGFDDRRPSSKNIDNNYVDGVSLTYGNLSRHHIWTFTPRVNSDTWNLENCDNDNKPDFVGNDFACTELLTVNTDHPNCNEDCIKSCPTSTNCSPEFYRNLVNQTSENIEMRVCTDQPKSDEDILIEDVEIYVK